MRFIQLDVVSEQPYMDGRIFRKTMGESYPQLALNRAGFKKANYRTFGDYVGWVMMMRLQEMEEKTLGINRVTIKDCITQVQMMFSASGKEYQFRREHHGIEMARKSDGKRETICVRVGNRNVTRWVPQLLQR